MTLKQLAFAAACMVASAAAGNTDDWKKRSVYQVLTDRFSQGGSGGSPCQNLGNYCGGTYQGIKNNLDYITGMGFDAIWISPVVKNMDGGYHGYWATNWEQLNDHFGSAQDLTDLVKACHDKGIWVMVDVVANHVAPIGNDFNQIYPLNRSEHYHNNCDINWNDQHSVEYCRLAGLPDLNQDNSYVRQYLKDWIHKTVQTYNFDGIRIDTIPEVSKDFWKEYGQAAGVFQMGECFNGDPAYVGPYQQSLTGLFNYPMYYTIKDVWQSGKSMTGIKDRFDQEQGKFSDIDALGLFVDNHDNARFLHGNSNRVGFTSAIVFSMTSRGIPFVYYGSEQYYGGGNDPANRESLWGQMNTNSDLYQIIAKVNASRKQAQIWNSPYTQNYLDDSFIAYSKGQFMVALTNQQGQQQRNVTYHPFSHGDTVCNIFHPDTDCQTVTDSVNVTLDNGEAKIYVPKSSLKASVFLQ